MLELDRRIGVFRMKERWFSDYPCDVGDCDTVSFYACKKLVYDSVFRHQEFTTSIVDLTHGLDVVWNNMSSGNCRKAIRRAERSGVTVKVNQGYDEFYKLYCFIEEFHSVAKVLSLDEIKKYGTLFVAELNGQVVSGHGYLEDSENIRSWVIGSRRFEGDKEYATMVANASKLIIWNVIQYAQAKGIKALDMGGVYVGENLSEQQTKFNTFKESFGGKLAVTHIYQKDYSLTYKCSKQAWQLWRRLSSGHKIVSG